MATGNKNLDVHSPFTDKVGLPTDGTENVHFGRYLDPRSVIKKSQQNTVQLQAGAGQSSNEPIPVSKCGKISSKGQTYGEIKTALLQSGALFEDPDFPATQVSIDYQTRGSGTISWKRPGNIVDNPQFVKDGTSRFDVQQGALGDCWLLAALANLSLYQDLLDQVVPPEQSFEKEYCGVFKFHFWQYGEWVEVIVDDRLPCDKSGLVYMHSHDKTEFWSALLEKAYAKLYGAYEALKGGNTIEAMEDFTGGLAETYELRAKTPHDMQRIMTVAYKYRSLMGCSIGADPKVLEAIQANGLIKGHAYSITKVTTIEIKSTKLMLVRVRNPWGNKNEWKGRWSDGSREWKQIPQKQRKELGLVFEDDGEFWMSFEDWSTEFEKMEMCCLGPQSIEAIEGSKDKITFETTVFSGSWCSGSSAGGCRNFLQTFWMNPQIQVKVEDADNDDADNKGTLIVGLMQKNRRILRQEGATLLTIGFMVFKLKEDTKTLMDLNFFKNNSPIAKSNAFINTREVTGRFRVPPGYYLIVPSTFQPNEQADFLMRIFSEKASIGEQMDHPNCTMAPPPSTVPTPINQAQTVALKRAFDKICGPDGVLSANELVCVLNIAFTQGFTVDACRTIITIMDFDRTGTLDFNEFKELWETLRLWKNIFEQYDVDKSGTISTFELRNAINNAGFSVDNATFASLVTRFSNLDRVMHFDEFITCMARLRIAFEVAMTGKSFGNSQLLNIMIHL